MIVVADSNYIKVIEVPGRNGNQKDKTESNR